jgi:Catalytic LigB subunit of aromatic ring-opening dioxygenase
MATVVGAVGTAHSPQVSLPGEQWAPYGRQEVASGRLDVVEYRSTHADPTRELSDEVTAGRAADCEKAVRRLRDAIDGFAPDVLVVVGDDQKELYRDDGIPAFAVFTGTELFDLPPGPQAYPSGMLAAYSAYHADGPEAYAVPADLATHVARWLVDDGIDMAVSAVQPDGRGLGHAFTFVRLRLTPDRSLPMVPIFINTYFPPNQPSPRRCVEFGRALRRALDAWEGDERILLVASGGLSHPIVDEALDRAVLAALATGDEGALAALPVADLEHGNSEIRNWIAVGAALADATFEVVEYVPGYRSERGSGCGMGFAVWSRAGHRPAPGNVDREDATT